MRKFDFVVVGAGSAGCTVASRLSENGKYQVALLEAGGSHNNPLISIPFNFAFTVPKGPHNWSFETVPQEGLNGRRGYQPRGKVLGGSSSINAMVYIRGAKEDYEHWAALGNEGWSYEEVLPFFKKAQNRVKGANEYHAQGGPLTVSPPRSPNPLNDMFIKAGMDCQLPYNEDFNGETQEGIGYYELTQDRGKRCSAALAYVTPAEKRKNLTIFKQAFVEKVLVENGQATGVMVKLNGNLQLIKARREVILSCGAFQSPQLLLLSGIGAKDKLDPHKIKVVHELPGVGENLYDHVDFCLMYQSDSEHVLGTNARSVFRVAWNQFKYFAGRRGILTTNFNESGAFYFTNPDERSPDIQLHFAFTLVDQHGLKRHGRGGFSCHVCVLRPKSHGNLTLADANPATPPLIDPAFLKDERDVATLLAGVKRAQQILQAPAFDEIRGKPVYATASNNDDELIEDIRNRADTIYHPVGTCKMGPDSDPMAVVDSSLRVRGIRNLRVIDASIMPSIVSGNTNAPTIMIGEKGAQMILDEAESYT